jgi:hypothetical protein
MARNTYIKASTVCSLLEKQLDLTGVTFSITSRQNKKGQEYKQLHFKQSDNTPIVQYVYCRIIKNEPHVLAASFKENMQQKDAIIDDPNVILENGLLF